VAARHHGTRVARFFLPQNNKTGKIYQMTIKYTKMPQNISISRKIDYLNRLNGHKIYQNLPPQVPPKFTQIRIFGLKICHLATLHGTVYTRAFSACGATRLRAAPRAALLGAVVCLHIHD
jgi:hypothetical protein